MKALVVFSGGLDSTMCLLLAIQEFGKDNILALFFNYGQKHYELEYNSAKKIAEELGVTLQIFHTDILAQIGNSNLIANSYKQVDNNLPNTFVPGRNILFLTIASAIAYKNNYDVIFTGVCANDNAGYPDCREDTIKSLQTTLSLGLEYDIQIRTPLLFSTKLQTLHLYEQLNQWEMVEKTHSCYNNVINGCGTCGSCIERNTAMAKYRAIK